MTPSRPSAGLVRFLFLAILLSASTALGVSRAAAQATLTSDQADYYLAIYEQNLPQPPRGNDRYLPGPLVLSPAAGPFDTPDAAHF